MHDGKEEANITLEHLGWVNRLVAMIGANNILYDRDGGLEFRFKGSTVANHCTFSVDDHDEYRLILRKIHGTKVTEVARFEHVQVANLRGVFEQATHLYLSL